MEDQNHFSPTDKFTLNSRIPFEPRVSSADTNLKFKKRTAPSFLSNDLNAVNSKKARQAICSVSPLRGKEEIPESMQTKQTICTSESLNSLTSQGAKNISELSRLNDDTFVRSSPMSNEHSRPETIEEPMRGNLISSLNSKAPTGLMGLFPEQRLPTELAGGIFKRSSATDTSRLYGQRDGPGYQEKAFPSSKSISKEVEEPKRSICLSSTGDLCGKSANHPSRWSAMPPEAKFVRVSVEINSDEFKEIERLFRETMKEDKFKIVSIERVQNPFLWETYCRKREYMVHESPQDTANEMRLFHGTKTDLVDIICKQNFDWRVRIKHGKKYGHGSYFADKASRSHRYTETGIDGESRLMFVARVLVGSYTAGKSQYRRPPGKDTAPESDLYDSCVDDVANPSIFVVFNMDQYYPEYVVKYVTTQLQGANPGPLSRHLGSVTAVSSLTSNIQPPKPSPAYPQKHTVNREAGNSSKKLRSTELLPSSTLNAQRPNTAAAKSTVSLDNLRSSHERLSFNSDGQLLTSASSSSMERPKTAPAKPGTLANGSGTSGRVRVNSMLFSSKSNVLGPNAPPERPPLNLANRRIPKERLGVNQVLSSSTLNAQQLNTATKNRPPNVADENVSSKSIGCNMARPSSSGSLRIKEELSSSSSNVSDTRLSNGSFICNRALSPNLKVEQPKTGPGIRPVTVANRSGLIGSLNSSSSEVQWSSTTPERPAFIVGCERNSRERLRTNQWSSFSTSHVQLPKTAARKNELSLARTSFPSRILSSNEVTSSSALDVQNPKAVPGYLSTKLSNERRYRGSLRLQPPNQAPQKPSFNVDYHKTESGSFGLSKELTSPISTVNRVNTSSESFPATPLNRKSSTRSLRTDTQLTSPTSNFQPLKAVRERPGQNPIKPSRPVGRSSFEQPITSHEQLNANVSNRKLCSEYVNDDQLLLSSTLDLQQSVTSVGPQTRVYGKLDTNSELSSLMNNSPRRLATSSTSGPSAIQKRSRKPNAGSTDRKQKNANCCSCVIL